MSKDHLYQKLGFIDQVRAIKPELACYCVLRMYTWPTAVLVRVANYVEIGAHIDDPLQFAVKQLRHTDNKKGEPPSKTTMLNFVMDQHDKVGQRATRDVYGRLVLPKTNIHVVKLDDAFQWNGALARQRWDMIADLAHCALDGGYRAKSLFDVLMESQIAYATRCINEVTTTINNLRASMR